MALCSQLGMTPPGEEKRSSVYLYMPDLLYLGREKGDPHESHIQYH